MKKRKHTQTDLCEMEKEKCFVCFYCVNVFQNVCILSGSHAMHSNQNGIDSLFTKSPATVKKAIRKVQKKVSNFHVFF